MNRKTRTIAASASLAVVLAGTAALAAAAPAAASSKAPQICNDNIVLRGHTLRADKIKGRWLAFAELSFHVYCVPKAGEFDMRLQEFKPSDDAWLTKGAAEKKDLTDTVPGENFSMRRTFECSGDLSWRIRFWVSPGIADNGTPTAPQLLFFPHPAGKQLECDATQPKGRPPAMTETAAVTPPLTVVFGDAIDPARIPATISHAALYGTDCDYPCPPQLAARFAPADRRWITFGGERKASIADFEPGTEVYHDTDRLRVWATVRAVRPALGLSIVYSDLSDVWKAQTAMRGAPHMWWLATKDTGWLTALELSERLAAEFGVTVHPSQIWGHQRILTSQPDWDESRTFGAWR